MSITLLRANPVAKVAANQNGFNVYRGIARFDNQTLTGTLDCPFQNVTSVSATLIGTAVANMSIGGSQSLGSVSATTSITLIAPFTGSISAVKIVNAANITSNDTNYWSFGVVNKTANLTLVDSTAATNTTKATGGSNLTAYGVSNLTLGNATQVAVSAGDVLELTATKTASATTLTELSIMVAAAGPNAQTIFCDDAAQVADGVIARETGGTITFTRQAFNALANQTFSFEIKGY